MTIGRYRKVPFAHQLDCLSKFGNKKVFALLAEMGTGKTFIIICNLADLWERGLCDGALILAPKGVHENWVDEFIKSAPLWLRYKTMVWSNSKSKKYAQSMSDFEHNISGHMKLLMMNHDAISTKSGFDCAMKFLMNLRSAAIIVDESDAFKNYQTERFKALIRLKPFSSWRRIMTGTPINNGPLDLWAQFYFLNPSILGHNSYASFRSEYAVVLPPNNPLVKSIAESRRGRAPVLLAKGPDGLPKYKNLASLTAKIDPHSFRALKSDCLDLPPKLPKTIYFNLTERQAKAYELMKEECRIELANQTNVNVDEVVAEWRKLVFEIPVSKLTSLVKLSQITSGFLSVGKIGDNAGWIESLGDENPKFNIMIDAVKKIVANGKKVIVWCTLRHEITLATKLFNDEGISYVEYHGGVSDKDRETARHEFQDGAASVFIGTQKSGGAGLTLVAASYVIYVSNSYSARARAQSEDRAHRIGQVEPVTILDIVARDTIDQVMINCFDGKATLSKLVLDHLSSGSKKL
jgi:SNF2 family DNA or RNA helicase